MLHVPRDRGVGGWISVSLTLTYNQSAMEGEKGYRRAEQHCHAPVINFNVARAQFITICQSMRMEERRQKTGGGFFFLGNDEPLSHSRLFCAKRGICFLSKPLLAILIF